MKRWLAAVALLSLVSCGGNTLEKDFGGPGELTGTVTVGPTCPVERAGSPCPPRPLAIDLVAIGSDGKVAARFSSDARGRYHVILQTGSYTIRPAKPGPPSGEVQVVVGPGRNTKDLQFDSGIR
jgi:hypothetical protein